MAVKKQNPSKLRDFMGVDPDVITQLEMIGIKHTGQMLAAGGTPESRASLAKRADIPLDAMLALVKLPDLSHLPGVKGIYTQSYYAGLDMVEKPAAYEPQVLLALTAEFVGRLMLYAPQFSSNIGA